MTTRDLATHGFTEKIPSYLAPYIATQDPSLYTSIDQASWRFILKISKAFLVKNAHQTYLDGLSETGISEEEIPLIKDMSQCLRKFNWQAVPVTGFIPPAVFTEFLSLGILPIACDMRSMEHLSYTPAPDIVHEAAGHAPIVADAGYADYLRSYGEISRKAIFSIQDMDVYNAIRHLSDTKENPASSESDINNSQLKLEEALASITYDSEATLLSRMGWWTFEYGLVGTLSQPKIYGAGLLSSLSESFHCFDPQVKKVPFTIECVETSYDITRPQPQLFVAPDFQTLKDGLKELGNKLAFRRGGIEALEKAKMAQTITTTEVESGVQVSGVLKDFLNDTHGRPCYVQFQGPTQIAYGDEEIEGQSATYHKDGFGSPLEKITDELLREAGLEIGKVGRLSFTSGVQVEGQLTQVLKRDGKILLLTFAKCTVKKGDEFLFRPEWGMFDMICGEKVVSVFGGAADREKYLNATGGFHQEPGRQKTNLTDANRDLNNLYAQVRTVRNLAKSDPKIAEKTAAHCAIELTQVYGKLAKSYPKDWLLRYEILELGITYDLGLECEKKLREELFEISHQSIEKDEMIRRGLELL
jgi:phenylalanine-4-hydroxylase